MKRAPLVVVVTGGRKWSRATTAAVNRELDRRQPAAVVHGGAPGVDAAARDWCVAARVPQVVANANWPALGRAAGPVRNRSIITAARASR